MKHLKSYLKKYGIKDFFKIEGIFEPSCSYYDNSEDTIGLLWNIAGKDLDHIESMMHKGIYIVYAGNLYEIRFISTSDHFDEYISDDKVEDIKLSYVCKFDSPKYTIKGCLSKLLKEKGFSLLQENNLPDINKMSIPFVHQD